MKIWRNIYDKDHVLRCKMYLEDYLVPYSYEEIAPYLEILDPSIYITVEALDQNPFVMIGQKESGHDEDSKDEDIDQEELNKIKKGIFRFLIGRGIPLLVITLLSSGVIHPGDGHILGISNLVIVMIIWFFMIPKILKSLK